MASHAPSSPPEPDADHDSPPPPPPLHARCKHLACLSDKDKPSLPAPASLELYRSYHAAMHAALAPLTEDCLRRRRFPSTALGLTREEARALLECALKVTQRPSPSAPLADVPTASPGSASELASRRHGESAAAHPELRALRRRLDESMRAARFGSRGCTAMLNGVSMRDALEQGRFRRVALAALLKLHLECIHVESATTANGVAAELDHCISRAMQLHNGAEVINGLAASADVRAELERALSFGPDLFVAHIVLTEFEPSLILHPSSHFRCVVSAGRILSASPRSAHLYFPHLDRDSRERILAGIADWWGDEPPPALLAGQRDYVLDVIVLGPPIVPLDEMRECDHNPIATQGPATARRPRKPKKKSKWKKKSKKNGEEDEKESGFVEVSSPSSHSEAEEEGHVGLHESKARLAAPYTRPYDIHVLHARAAQPSTAIGLFRWDELQLGGKAKAQVRTVLEPRADVMQCVPPLWRHFVETECQPRSALRPALDMLRGMAPSFAVILAALVGLALATPSFRHVLLSGAAVLLVVLSVALLSRKPAEPDESHPVARYRTKHADGTTGSDEEPVQLVAPGMRLHRLLLSTPHAFWARIRQFNLTPLIRIELAGSVVMPFALLRNQHAPDIGHLSLAKRSVVRMCGAHAVLRWARLVAGSHRWRVLGHLPGTQILGLLLPHERYNFVVASRPNRVVISHVGAGEVGGLYAKHALLAELNRVAFAGELWMDEKHAVHVNNSSGTYRPSNDMLGTVERFLQDALQIPVHAHKRPDKDGGAGKMPWQIVEEEEKMQGNKRTSEAEEEEEGAGAADSE